MSNQGQDPKESLRQSFAKKSADELALVCSELVISYVAKKQPPSIAQLGMHPVPSNLREMDFHQLISWLKHNLSLPELQQFEITDSGVSIRFGEQLVPMTASTFQGTPTAPAVSHAPSSPSPPPTNQAPPPVRKDPTSSEPQPQPPTASAPNIGKEKDDGDLSERFSMLEID